jgi:hypothetical protein
MKVIFVINSHIFIAENVCLEIESHTPCAKLVLDRKLFRKKYSRVFIFSRPKYRYPYYDINGKGKLLYGYGGPELFQYKSYSPIEGIH